MRTTNGRMRIMMNADDGNIVTLHIKAETTEEAANAMAERHIPAFPGSVMRVPSGFGFRAETAGRFIQDVMRWFGETSEADCRDGEGFPIGSLLLFSERKAVPETEEPRSLSIVEFDGDVPLCRCWMSLPGRMQQSCRNHRFSRRYAG